MKKQSPNVKGSEELKLVKILLILIVVLTLAKFLIDSFGRYESNAAGEAEASVAFFIIDEKVQENTILLGEITPSTEPYVYTFLVSNFEENKKSDVDLTYSLEFTTTTNLPLTYELYKNQEPTDTNAVDIISQQEVTADTDGTYFNKLIINETGKFTHKEQQTDTYKLVVIFDENYKNTPDKYEGLVESVRVKIDAKQDI